jgi:hypothetical protein
MHAAGQKCFQKARIDAARARNVCSWPEMVAASYRNYIWPHSFGSSDIPLFFSCILHFPLMHSSLSANESARPIGTPANESARADREIPAQLHPKFPPGPLLLQPACIKAFLILKKSSDARGGNKGEWRQERLHNPHIQYVKAFKKRTVAPNLIDRKEVLL